MSASKKKKTNKKNNKKVNKNFEVKQEEKDFIKEDSDNSNEKVKENDSSKESNLNEEKDSKNIETNKVEESKNEQEKTPKEETEIKEPLEKSEEEENKTSKNKKNNKNKDKASEDLEKDKKEKSSENQNKEEVKENNEEAKIEEKQEEKSIVKVNEKPEYVEEMLRNKKRKMYIFICIVVIVLLVIAFSTFFAIFNLNNTTFTKGVKVNNIDISGLTTEEAEAKINEAISIELLPEINLKYSEDYQITLKPEQIEYKYNVENAINEAYSVGRSGNIVENNYSLLLTTFFGKNIDLKYTFNEELLNGIVDDINSKLPGLVVEPSYYIEGQTLIVEKGKDGIEVDKEKLKKEIISNISSRKLEDVIAEGYNQTIKIPVRNAKASNIDMDKVYSEVHTEPQDAYFETEPYKIYPDVDGIDLAISLEEAKQNIQSEDKEEYTFPLKITKASKTINDLGTEAFPYLISSFSTKYDASNRNRSTNLEIAANKINGKVLMPGEVFSFNKVVGKRTVEEGYRDAKIYADGGVVDGLAGGICQISSTLYNAVLLANLEIVERRNHSFPTSYVATGRDATVVYGAIDFQFKNSRSYPIKIEATVRNGIAEFKFHGMQEEKEYEIKILPVTTGSIPFATSYIDDPTLAPGQQVVVQSGHPGYKVTTYKEVRYNGEVVSKEILSNDTYSPMKTIIRRGPGVPVQ